MGFLEKLGISGPEKKYVAGEDKDNYEVGEKGVNVPLVVREIVKNELAEEEVDDMVTKIVGEVNAKGLKEKDEIENLAREMAQAEKAEEVEA